MPFTDIQLPEWAAAEGWTAEEWADLMQQAEDEYAHNWLDWAVEACEGADHDAE